MLFLTLAGLFALHYWMDVLDPPESQRPSDRVAFGVAHGLYVVIALLQTVAALVYLGLAVSAWRSEDVKTVIPKEDSGGGREGGEGRG